MPAKLRRDETTQHIEAYKMPIGWLGVVVAGRGPTIGALVCSCRHGGTDVEMYIQVLGQHESWGYNYLKDHPEIKVRLLGPGDIIEWE